MTILPYDPLRDEAGVMQLLQNQGKEWACYWAKDVQAAYRRALRLSITRVAYVEGELVGYVRALDDQGFYVYVCDLLVDPASRGQHLGRKLMETLVTDYPGQTVYVMSDVDPYYEKLGYVKAGSVYEVIPQTASETDE
jgi:ribosomal protein S18 acetylase RimI-like enzyme